MTTTGNLVGEYHDETIGTQISSAADPLAAVVQTATTAATGATTNTGIATTGITTGGT